MLFPEIGQPFVMGNSRLQINVETGRFNYKLLLIPLKFFEIQINQIAIGFPPHVQPSKNNHVLPHKRTSMRSSGGNQFLSPHFHDPSVERMNVNDVDRIVADSTLAADIVLPHPSKYQRIFIFVENGGMITSG